MIVYRRKLYDKIVNTVCDGCSGMWIKLKFLLNNLQDANRIDGWMGVC
jgi:hypothetical protein